MSGPRFDAKQFECVNVSAPTFDGELVPITLLHKKNLKRSGFNKLLLHGYGFYGLPLEVEFNVVALSALE